jgi:8-oxo-dGTP diphosphatase
MSDSITKIGCGILIFKDGKVLLGKRKGSHGEGLYGGPGGHFEYMESFEGAIKREIAEECGVEITNIRFLCISNFKDHVPKHYLDLGFAADWVSGEPQLLEPDKCEGWDWYSPENLPGKLFGVVSHYFESLETGKNFFDA